MKKNHLSFLTALLFLLMIGCSPEAQNNKAAEAPAAENKTPLGQAGINDDLSAKNIIQVAIGSKDHSTLVAAVQAAGIEHVLANNGPLTVFAPTNAAFDALPAGTVENLLKPENQTTLKRIITFHAAPGTYKSDALKDGMSLFQATGDHVKIENKDGVITVNGAKILGSVAASNGVVHVVDKVLLPPERN